MKTKTSKTIKKYVFALFLSVAFTVISDADSFASLAGAGDSVIIHQGETALVMAGAGTFTYAKKGQSCAYIRLSSNRNNTLRETSHRAIPLVGPCVITVRCPDGYLGMQIVASGVRPVTEKSRVASVAPVKSAVRP